MPSTPSKGPRSRWGMARFELETNYAEIQPVVKSAPNYTVAYEQLLKDKIITITYAAFVRTWKKIQAERGEQPRNAKAPAQKPTEAAPEQPAAKPQQKTRKPLPEINKFTMPTGSDGVRDQW